MEKLLSFLLLQSGIPYYLWCSGCTGGVENVERMVGFDWNAVKKLGS